LLATASATVAPQCAAESGVCASGLLVLSPPRSRCLPFFLKPPPFLTTAVALLAHSCFGWVAVPTSQQNTTYTNNNHWISFFFLCAGAIGRQLVSCVDVIVRVLLGMPASRQISVHQRTSCLIRRLQLCLLVVFGIFDMLLSAHSANGPPHGGAAQHMHCAADRQGAKENKKQRRRGN